MEYREMRQERQSGKGKEHTKYRRNDSCALCDTIIIQSEIADIDVAQGNLPDARVVYTAANKYFRQIAEADPSNTGFQRDLAVSDERLAMIAIDEKNLKLPNHGLKKNS